MLNGADWTVLVLFPESQFTEQVLCLSGTQLPLHSLSKLEQYVFCIIIHYIYNKLLIYKYFFSKVSFVITLTPNFFAFSSFELGLLSLLT